MTRGLGAGGNPELGEIAATESKESLGRVVMGSDLVFITAGMGGGTNSTTAQDVAPPGAHATGALGATTLPDAAATEALLDFGEFIKGMADDVKPPPLTARDLVHWAAFVKHLEGKVDVVEALGHGCGVVLDGLGVANPCVEADALEACRDVCERRFAEICRGMGDVEDALKWDRAGPPLARDAHVYLSLIHI